jgi:putative transposase
LLLIGNETINVIPFHTLLQLELQFTILKSLDQKLKEYQQFPIALKYKYLLLDGFWIHILEGDVLTKRCVVCAMGITDTGEHDLLGFKLMAGESEESIKVFLNDLHRRGLTDIDLIIHDDSKGIENASKLIFPYAEHQRCVFHK